MPSRSWMPAVGRPSVRKITVPARSPSSRPKPRSSALEMLVSPPACRFLTYSMADAASDAGLRPSAYELTEWEKGDHSERSCSLRDGRGRTRRPTSPARSCRLPWIPIRPARARDPRDDRGDVKRRREQQREVAVLVRQSRCASRRVSKSPRRRPGRAGSRYRRPGLRRLPGELEAAGAAALRREVEAGSERRADLPRHIGIDDDVELIGPGRQIRDQGLPRAPGHLPRAAASSPSR